MTLSPSTKPPAVTPAVAMAASPLGLKSMLSASAASASIPSFGQS